MRRTRRPRQSQGRRTFHFERWKPLIEAALRRALPTAAQAPPRLREAMRYCVLAGGKRFRPLLCLAACEAVGAPALRALPVACALELIHTYSLVHDDLPAMDNAEQRRGRPACHRRFGEGHAILVGDALLTLAFERLSRRGTSFDSPRRKAGLAGDHPERHRGATNTLAILRTIGRACGSSGLIGGQVLDLEGARNGGAPPAARERRAEGFADSRERRAVNRLQDIARRKTAALITASVVSGALSGGGSPRAIHRLRGYGRRMGVAFQLLDDAQDAEGFSQVMGAPAARAQAHRLIARAVKVLPSFGRRAQALRELAAWLSTMG